MLMAHKEYGFHHIPDGMKEQAESDGWFVVTDLAAAKAVLYGTDEPVVEVEADKPRRGRKPKVQ